MSFRRTVWVAALSVLFGCGGEIPQPGMETSSPTQSEVDREPVREPETGDICRTCDPDEPPGPTPNDYYAYFQGQIRSIKCLDADDWWDGKDHVRLVAAHYWDTSSHTFWPNPTYTTAGTYELEAYLGRIQIYPDQWYCSPGIPGRCYTPMDPVNFVASRVSPGYSASNVMLWANGHQLGSIYLPAWVGSYKVNVAGSGYLYEVEFTVSYVSCSPGTTACPTYFGP